MSTPGCSERNEPGAPGEPPPPDDRDGLFNELADGSEDPLAVIAPLPPSPGPKGGFTRPPRPGKRSAGTSS
jgi:hypothetical protein